jgi:hypothetical protein
LALPIFAITLFVSAFLLFIVQPMIGKMILPVLGGTPQVWNTCCVFFQSVLLLGYFYTHATTTYLKPRMQMILHGALLIVPLVLLLGVTGPFSAKGFDPPTGVNPIWATLFFLALIVGVPFFVVSTSAPLLQRWFSYSGDPTADDPYFLYGASNLGSLLSLLAYPYLVEPAMYVTTQANFWIAGYAILVGLCAVSAFLVWNRVPATAAEAAAGTSTEMAENVAPEPVPAMAPPETPNQPGRLVGKRKGLKSSPAPDASQRTPAPTRTVARVGAYDPTTAPITWLRCLRWICLAAIPSSLMLGVTTYVSTDLSPFPLLWIIPLSLYLLSFILVFSKWPLPWTGLPHTIFLYLMPMSVIVLLFQLFAPNSYYPYWPTRIQFGAFFIITMAMHGELAKDRPATQHLTLFFLCMSIGGVLGGIFNAIVAPIVFKTVIEYPLAIFFGCLLRPNMTSAGWIDGLILENQGVRESAAESSDSFAKSFGQKPTGEPFLLSYAVDIGIGVCIAILAWVCVTYQSTFYQGLVNILLFLGATQQSLAPWRAQLSIAGVWGLGFIACLIVMPRSLRFAIGIGALLFMFTYGHEREGQIHADRSYFGVLRVLHEQERLFGASKGGDKRVPLWDEASRLPEDFESPTWYNYLMHGSTYHGRSYQSKELARLATTYYHRFGPVGAVTEKYNWLPGPQNTYRADLRLPVSMIGLGASPVGMLPLPTAQLLDAWSEPPFATVGLGTGTMASYGRWLQHVVYYEIDEKIRDMNVPPNNAREPYFLTVRDTMDRQANVEIIMGDARQSLQKEKKRFDEWEKNPDIVGRGPTPYRENYYKWLNLDAFSSDAIPVHLITQEAIKLYMSKLAPDGVLMVHTSNRHLNLVAPVADICRKERLVAIVGKDQGGSEDVRERWNGPKRIWSLGHYGSEYVMVANKDYVHKDVEGKTSKRDVISVEILKTAVKPEIRDGVKYLTSIVQWSPAKPPGREVWSDHYQDIVSIMRGGGGNDEE